METWSYLFSMTGPTGDTGPSGLLGSKGDTGSRGDSGLPGSKGDTGSQGLKGDTGIGSGSQGPQGETGSRGDSGLPGSQGDTGARGIGNTSTWILSESPEDVGNMYYHRPGDGSVTLQINPIDGNGTNSTSMLNTIIALVSSGLNIIIAITDGINVMSFNATSGISGSPYYTFGGILISSYGFIGPLPYTLSYNITNTIGDSGLLGSKGDTGVQGLKGDTGVGSGSGSSYITESTVVNESLQLLLAVGNSPTQTSTIQTSSDGGLSWTGVTEGGFSSQGNGVCGLTIYDPKGLEYLYIAVGQDSEQTSTIQKSVAPGGTIWNGITSGGFTTGGNGVVAIDVPAIGMTVGYQLAIAVGTDSERTSTIQRSTGFFDVWTGVTSGGFSAAGKAIIYASSIFMAVGEDSEQTSTIQKSTDGGLTWTGINSGGFLSDDVNSGNGIAFANIIDPTGSTTTSTWVAVGSIDTNHTSTIQYSTNGNTWTSVATGGFQNGGRSVAYGNGVWVAVGVDTVNPLNTIQYSTADSTIANWSSIASGGFPGGGYGVTFDGSKFIAVGFHSDPTSTIQISSNGSDWTNTTGGFINAGNGVAANIYTTTTTTSVLTINQINLQNNRVLLGLNNIPNTGGANSVAIGAGVGNGQGSNSVAIGSSTGFFFGSGSQGANAIAIGTDAGINQSNYAVAIGNNAGQDNQGNNSIAIGASAGQNNQSNSALAIGSYAGNSNQGTFTVALGYYTAASNQGDNCVAIGNYAGAINQGINSIAIGASAGQNNQSNYSIAIGFQAGSENQHPNTVILNASGQGLNSDTSNAFYVKPIRFVNSLENLSTLYYNPITFEVIAAPTSGGGGEGSGTQGDTGVAGTQGDTGPQGPGTISAAGEPDNTVGTLGQLYYDTVNGNLYGPKQLVFATGIQITQGPAATWSFYITDTDEDANIRPIENGGAYPNETQYIKIVYSGASTSGTLVINTENGSGTVPDFGGEFTSVQYSLLNNNNLGAGNISVVFKGITVLAITYNAGTGTVWPLLSGGGGGTKGDTGVAGASGSNGKSGDTGVGLNGDTGVQGLKGDTGVGGGGGGEKGDTGAQGLPGFGGLLSSVWNTGPDTLPGWIIRGHNSLNETMDSLTSIQISKNDNNNTSWETLFTYINNIRATQVVYFQITDTQDPTTFGIYHTIPPNGDSAYNGTYLYLANITFVAGIGSFISDKNYTISFSISSVGGGGSGTQGDTGVGLKGDTGVGGGDGSLPSTISVSTINTTLVNFSYPKPSSTYTYVSTGGASLFIASGKVIDGTSEQSLLWSPDGSNWNSSITGGFGIDKFGNDVAYGNGVWIAVGESEGSGGTRSIVRSTDGYNWNPPSIGTFGGQGNGVAYGNNMWVAVGEDQDNSRSIQNSTNNGLNWNPALLNNTIMPSSKVNGVAYGNSLWVAVGEDDSVATKSIVYSTTTSNWSNIVTGGFGMGALGFIGRDVAYGNNMWVAVGDTDGDIDPLTSIQWSPDGSNWSNAITGGFSNNAYGIAYGNGLWVAVGNSEANNYRSIQWSTNGSNWNYIVEGGFSLAGGKSVTYTNGQWVAIGHASNEFQTSQNGSNWFTQDCGLQFLGKSVNSYTSSPTYSSTVIEYYNLLTTPSWNLGIMDGKLNIATATKSLTFTDTLIDFLNTHA